MFLLRLALVALTVGCVNSAIYVSSIQIKPNRWKTTEKYMYGFMYEKSWQTVVSMKAYRRVCYYTNWAQYRNSAGKFFPENVDPTLCTHIIYSFAKLVGNRLHAYEWNDESTAWMKGMYERFDKLKNINPNLKTMLAVGGWNMASAPFTRMVASSASRQEFATSTVKFLRDHNFDGIDLDWEYPANRGSPPGDKQKFGQLLETVKHEFELDAKKSGKPRLIISAATAAGKDKIDTAYDFPALIKYLDMINLMTYDLHGSWEDHTGHNSPLYKHAGESGNDTYLNLDWAAQYYVKQGVPPSMINIGMGLYGRSFTLQDPNNNDIGSKVRGAGQSGQFTREKGFMAYYEICNMLRSGGVRHYIADQMVPYVVKGTEWVGYDDRDSLRLKAKYVKQNHFGGIMVWALDLDDFSGSCGEGKYPLLNAINDELKRSGGSIVQPVVTQAPRPSTRAPTNAPTTAPTNSPTTAVPKTTTHGPQPTTHGPQPATQGPQSSTTTAAQATQPPAQTNPTQRPVTTKKPAPTGQTHQIGLTTRFNCQGRTSGFYPNTQACDEYFICAGTLAFEVRCASGLHFNTKSKFCDWPSNVNCVTQQNTHQQNTNGPVLTHKTTNAPRQPSSTMAGVTNAPWATNAPVTNAPVITNAPVTHAPIVTNAPFTHGPAMTNAPTQAPLPTARPWLGNGNKHTFCDGKADGHYRDPNDCVEYYVCSLGLTFHQYCAPGTVFNEQLTVCDFPLHVPGC